MGPFGFLSKVMRCRWNPTSGLVVAGLVCPLLVWMAVPALLKNLDDLFVALRGITLDLARSPNVTQGSEPHPPSQFPSSRQRRALAATGTPADATQNISAPVSSPVLVEDGEMPPPTRVELAPVAFPPPIPPSVELAELIAFGVTEPGAVEFDLDPEHPVAGQGPDSTYADSAAEMPPPTRVEPPPVADPQVIPPRVELTEHNADGLPEPGAAEFDLDPNPSVARQVLTSALADSPEMPPPTWLEPPPVPAPLPISPSKRLAELIEQGAVTPGEMEFEVAAEEPAE